MSFQSLPINWRGFTIVLFIVAVSSLVISQASDQKGLADSSQRSDSRMETTPLTEPIDLDTMTDEDWLHLPGRIPPGLTYEKTKELFPNLDELVTAGAGSTDPKYGLYETYLSITIFDRPAKMAFSYSNNSVTSYGIEIRDIDSITAEQWYHRLKDFYYDLYGQYEQEREVSNFFYEACYWRTDVITLTLCKNVYSSDNAYLGWGL